jgi:hypothetical protein
MKPPILLEEPYRGFSNHLTYELPFTVSFRHSLQPGPSFEGEKKFNLKKLAQKTFYRYLCKILLPERDKALLCNVN